MAYFQIGSHDYSAYTSSLKVGYTVNYTSQTNASYNSVIDYHNTKTTVEVEIIPLDDETMKQLLTDIKSFSIKIFYREPQTGALAELPVVCSSYNTDYYTIQQSNVKYKKMKLKFTQL